MGNPTPPALGDDSNHLDDEDGVFLIYPLLSGEEAGVDIFATAPGFLDAWVDFNMDGDWADEGEQIFVSLPLAPGVNSHSFYIPPWASGQTYARFRFSADGGLSFEGPAFSGEVEDYLVEIDQGV